MLAGSDMDGFQLRQFVKHRLVQSSQLWIWLSHFLVRRIPQRIFDLIIKLLVLQGPDLGHFVRVVALYHFDFYLFK